jgi:phosphopantothenoylcysteine decarboxylase/phosphopantothenate--cysteine ligase
VRAAAADSRAPAIRGHSVPLDPAAQYVRHPLATAVTTADRVLFTRPGTAAHCTLIAPEVAAELWAMLAAPAQGGTLVREDGSSRERVAGLIESLIDRGFVLRWDEEPGAAEPPARPVERRPCRHLVLGITGAVQAIFAPQVVDRLARGFAERLDVVLTRSAGRLVRPRALALAGARVWCSPWDSTANGGVPHVELAAGAELVLVLPASAAAIARLAHGACSDLLSLVVTATRAPVVVVPSMNDAMWHHPAVQRNVRLLRADGAYVVEPGPGFSAASRRSAAVGGAGLGPDAVNLIGTLESVLAVSR